MGLSLLALLAGLEIPGRPPGGTAPYVPPPLPALWDRLLGVWSRWDGQWYLQIATAGYRPTDGTTAFFPLYPWAVGALGTVLGGRYLWAGVILSSAIFAGVLVLLYQLVRTHYAADLAPRTVLYLAIFPTAFFFWAVYSEGLFLLLALGMFLAAGQRRWWLASLCLGAALWTRPFGVVLVPCLLLEFGLWVWAGRRPHPQPPLRTGEGATEEPSPQGREGRVRGESRPMAMAGSGDFPPSPQPSPPWGEGVTRASNPSGAAAEAGAAVGVTPNVKSIMQYTVAVLAVPALAGVALLAWAGAALGDPLVFLRTQAEWNRAFSWPWDTVVNAVKVAAAVPFSYQEENQSWFYLATLVLFGALAVAGWVRGWLRPAHALYLTLGLLFPLLSATPHNPLLSLPRFVLVLFPAFILLARAGRYPVVHYLILIVSVLLLGLYTIRFANWFWVA